jgi:hypothetical protein
VEPPHMRRYSSVESDEGDMGTSSHLHNVIAAVKPATPRQAASSKPRPFGRGRTVCAGTVTKDWKQPARRSL